MPICWLNRWFRPGMLAIGLMVAGMTQPPGIQAAGRPGPVPPELREKWKLDPFYQKTVDVGGFPVVGSAKVSDNALAEAAWIIEHMLVGREDIFQAMASQKIRAAIMAASEYTTDVPEHKNLKPKVFWDRRARGLGATLDAPAVSGAEENLLSFERDPYPNENIFLHEFAHAIHETGMNKVDPTFDRRLRTAFEAARERGLWKNTYAASNRMEYWAEGSQSWFDDNAPPDALHNNIRTRAQLKEYDPGLAALCKEVYGDGTWRYIKPRDRKPEDRKHLVDFDPRSKQRFRWREAPLIDTPRVLIQTSVGDFEVELDARSAPAATSNFLRVALDGGYHSGRFTQSITGPEGSGILIASPNANWSSKWQHDLKLDELPRSSASLAPGTIGLVRDSRGSVGFALVVGSPTSSEVTASIVPFGKVFKGEDVLKKILVSPASNGVLTTPVDVRRIIRNE